MPAPVWKNWFKIPETQAGLTYKNERSRHGESSPEGRTDPGSSERGSEVSAAETLHEDGARQDHGDLPASPTEPREVLGGTGEGAEVDQAMAQEPRMEASLCEVVYRRQAECFGQLHRPSP